MVKNQDQLRDVIVKVIDFLKTKLELDAVILFGSYAGGSPDKFSDIDLAVISPDSAGKSLEEKATLFSAVKLKCDLDVEIHFFSTDEFRRAGPAAFLGHIRQTGKYYLKDNDLVA